jgi:hypothetical protein
MTEPDPQITLEPLVNVVGQDFLAYEEHWRVVLLHRNGKSLVKQQMEEMDREGRTALLAKLKVLAGSERLRNDKLVGRWSQDSNVLELRVKAWRLMFFYFHRQRAIVLTNLFHKSAEARQHQAFAVCHRLREETLRQLK